MQWYRLLCFFIKKMFYWGIYYYKFTRKIKTLNKIKFASSHLSTYLLWTSPLYIKTFYPNILTPTNITPHTIQFPQINPILHCRQTTRDPPKTLIRQLRVPYTSLLKLRHPYTLFSLCKLHAHGGSSSRVVHVRLVVERIHVDASSSSSRSRAHASRVSTFIRSRRARTKWSLKPHGESREAVHFLTRRRRRRRLVFLLRCSRCTYTPKRTRRVCVIVCADRSMASNRW